MKENKYLIFAILMILGIVSVSGCTNNSQSGTTANTVNIQNMAFNPATLNVKVGTTVKWVNMDSTTHQVVSNTGVFNSGVLKNGQSYTYTFNKTGTYPYYCSIHPSMKGTIVVTKTAPSNTSTSSKSSSGSTSGYGY